MARDSKGRFTKGNVSWQKGKRTYKPNCLFCENLIDTCDKRKKFCNHSCALKYQHENGREISENFINSQKGLKKGQTNSGSFKKGNTPNHSFPKGEHPWNYIDGRSKIIGPARYGDDWFKIRLLIYKRDNYTCQKCAEKMSKIPFHIHHKIPFLISFDNSLKNLITLCPPCHRIVEAIIMRELKNQKVEV